MRVRTDIGPYGQIYADIFRGPRFGTLSVEFHMQRLGYIRSRPQMLYLYVFDTRLNKHDTLFRLLPSRKSHHQRVPLQEDTGGKEGSSV